VEKDEMEGNGGGGGNGGNGSQEEIAPPKAQDQGPTLH
jgi:hypothetical protein